VNTATKPVRVCVLGSLLLLAGVECQAQNKAAAPADTATYAAEQGSASLAKFNLGSSVETVNTEDGSARYTGIERGFGFVYSPSDNVNAYGLRRRAFEAPALSTFPQRAGRDNPGLDFWLRPRSVGDTEIGLKARIGKSLTANVAAFRSDNDEEFGSRIGPAGLYTGRTRREGIEFSVDNRWSNGVSALLSYSLSRSSYSDTLCGNVCVSLARSGTYGRTYAPDQIVYGELSWRYPRFGLVTAVEAKYVGRGYTDGLNSDQTAAYFVANARLGLEQQAGRWRLQEFARVDNLSGRSYFGLSTNDTGLRLVDPAATRNYSIGISAGYSW
jgi:iron complex outermembrane recepter protein